MQEMGDVIEGVSGRWTFFTQLHKVDQPEPKIAATVFSIDSTEELRVGIGRLFDSKKTIGEQQAIVSRSNLESLGAKVGEPLSIHYDLKLFLSMFQTLTGEILPKILTRPISKE